MILWPHYYRGQHLSGHIRDKTSSKRILVPQNKVPLSINYQAIRWINESFFPSSLKLSPSTIAEDQIKKQPAIKLLMADY